MTETEENTSVYSRSNSDGLQEPVSHFVISSRKAWILKNLTDFMPQVDGYVANHLAPCQQPEPFPPPKPAPRSVYPQEDDA